MHYHHPYATQRRQWRRLWATLATLGALCLGVLATSAAALGGLL